MKWSQPSPYSMCISDNQPAIETSRYLEVNAEHLGRFLQGMDRDLRFDRADLVKLLGAPSVASSDTLGSGGFHGQMGIPGMRCKG